VRKWNDLFVNGCQWKCPMYKMAELFSSCHLGKMCVYTLGIFWKLVTLQRTEWDTLNTCMITYLTSMSQEPYLLNLINKLSLL
jgi:hypothetical protein